MKTTKPRTSWLVIALFIVLVVLSVSTMSGATIYYIGDAETKHRMMDFLDDFRPGHITVMPTYPRGVVEDIKFFLGFIIHK